MSENKKIKEGICKINNCDNKSSENNCFKCNLTTCEDHMHFYIDYFDLRLYKYNRVFSNIKFNEYNNQIGGLIIITKSNYCCTNCLKQVLDTEICKM